MPNEYKNITSKYTWGTWVNLNHFPHVRLISIIHGRVYISNQIKSFSFSSSLKEEGAKEQQHGIGSRRGM